MFKLSYGPTVSQLLRVDLTVCSKGLTSGFLYESSMNDAELKILSSIIMSVFLTKLTIYQVYLRMSFLFMLLPTIKYLTVPN